MPPNTRVKLTVFPVTSLACASVALVRSIVSSIVVVALISAGSTAAVAQDDPHAACAAPPSYVPAELLERPVPLRTGIGNSHEVVTTASAEAQAYYDQGLNYLESYVWIEAARSFHQAVRLDPGMAMAYVGLSYVHSGLDNPDAAKRYLEKAKAAASGVGDRERRRIEIREKQLAAMENLEDTAKNLAYKKAIEDALAGDLENPLLWLLRGNAEESNASGRGQRGTASSVAFYEKVLRLVPDHASAHHYLVHSCETIGRIDKALEHGEAYARLSPAIPHAAHMWGHDLRRVGRIDEAIVQFLKTDSLERAYYKAEKIDPSFDWHHGHNLDLLATCYQHKGQVRLAEKTMREAATACARGRLSRVRPEGASELPDPPRAVRRGSGRGTHLDAHEVLVIANGRSRAHGAGVDRAGSHRGRGRRAGGRATRARGGSTRGSRRHAAPLAGGALGRVPARRASSQNRQDRGGPRRVHGRAARAPCDPRSRRVDADVVPSRVDGAERDGDGQLGSSGAHREADARSRSGIRREPSRHGPRPPAQGGCLRRFARDRRRAALLARRRPRSS